MAKTVVMPQMGYDMDSGTLLRWIKQEGDQVTRGEAIAEIETDKVNIEIEAFDSGVLRKTLITEGQTVPVGEAIAIIGEEGEEIDVPESAEAPPSTNGKEPAQAAEPAAPAESMTPPEGATEPAPAGQQAATATATQEKPQTVERDPGERIRASPLVRRLSEEHGIDLSQVNGTGPHGRIVKRDIEGMVSGEVAKPAARAAEAAPAAAEAPAPSAAPEPVPTQGGEIQELPRIRQTIGKRMSQSFRDIPHFYVSVQINMDAALALRKDVNGSLDDASKISVNDLVVKATAMALQKFPVLNSSYVDGKMELHPNIDINIAVAIEGGLISPFIPGADKKSLGEIARMTKDLGGRAKEGKLKPDEYAGGTFTISNLGMFGEIDSFLAIINPPQAGILAIGTAIKQPVWNPETEEFDPISRMSVTMSADHRLTDGAEVARYLDELKGLLENPMRLLVG